MTEREMETLLAEHPADFFPRKNLALKGRQGSFSGVGRFDLLFEDEFGTNILMELKARPGKYEDATQLARYKDELERRGEKNLLMWLVAPQIPNSVREFLDRIGIEYTEIHVSEYQHVARRHGVALGSGDDAPSLPLPLRERQRAAQVSGHSATAILAQIETGPEVTTASTLRWNRSQYALVLVNREAFDRALFLQLVDAFEHAVPSRKNARVIANLRSWAADEEQPLPLAHYQSLLRWVITSGWKEAVPYSEAIWKYLFGSPAPTWHTWNGSKYIFDANGWLAWFASLPH